MTPDTSGDDYIYPSEVEGMYLVVIHGGGLDGKRFRHKFPYDPREPIHISDPPLEATRYSPGAHATLQNVRGWWARIGRTNDRLPNGDPLFHVYLPPIEES